MNRDICFPQFRMLAASVIFIAIVNAAGAVRAETQDASSPKTFMELAGLNRSQVLHIVGVAARTSSESATEHPLAEIVRYAYDRFEGMPDKMRDYRCRLVKRERVGGQISAHEFLSLKVRHQAAADAPSQTRLGVYLKFLGPASIKGREVLYVEGEYDGRLIATKGGHGPLRHFTITASPDSGQAMEGNRFPITQIGILNLTRRLIEDGVEHMRADRRGECIVRDKRGAKIDGRSCRYVEVTFPVERPGFRFHKAQVFIDDELEIPVRYAAYDWPKKDGGVPLLLEEYTYTNLELNVGLSDIEFQRDNPDYHFYLHGDK